MEFQINPATNPKLLLAFSNDKLQNKGSCRDSYPELTRQLAIWRRLQERELYMGHRYFGNEEMKL